jgi:signal transduction histidine kinase
LIGLLRVRLATADASRALLESNPRTHQEAQAALRRALDDPSLELVYWMPEPPGYVNEAGKSVDLPTDSRAWTAIEYDGRPAAAILHDPWLTQEPERIAAVVSAARLTVERDRLQAEVRAKMDELRSSRARIVEAGDTERRRLERNLHDGAQQRLVSLSLSLGIMERQLESPDQAAAVAGLRSELTDALNELRELARGLHPAILSDHGLAPALEGLAARASVPVELDVDIDGRLPPPIEAATYYVISEALTNIQKYAQATSARVALALDDDEVMLEVTDDGVGGADATQGSGLQGLADRIEALAGSLSIDSPKGGGTSLRAKIPHGLRD